MKYFLITGHRKSGTSLLHRLFDGHPKIELYPTDVTLLYAFFPFFTKKYEKNSRLYKKRLLRVIKKSLQASGISFGASSNDGVFANEIFSRLKKVLKNNKNNPKVILKGLLKAWISVKKSKKKCILFKETSLVSYFPSLLSKNFPTKVIIVVRDPRDNFASISSGIQKYYSKFGETKMTALAACINRLKFDLSLLGQYTKSNKFYICKYENLVEKPIKEIKKICNFLQVKFNNNLLLPTKNGILATGNNFDGKKFRKVSNSNVKKYKTRISSFEIDVIEWFLNNEMKKLGYLNKLSSLRAHHYKSIESFYRWYNYNYFYKDSFK